MYVEQLPATGNFVIFDGDSPNDGTPLPRGIGEHAVSATDIEDSAPWRHFRSEIMGDKGVSLTGMKIDTRENQPS